MRMLLPYVSRAPSPMLNNKNLISGIARDRINASLCHIVIGFLGSGGNNIPEVERSSSAETISPWSFCPTHFFAHVFSQHFMTVINAVLLFDCNGLSCPGDIVTGRQWKSNEE